MAGKGDDKRTSKETFFSLSAEIFPPFVVAGAGMAAAGCLLDRLQFQRVFKEIPEIFILVPALIGLKGNLEMTLASRLSTLANVGLLESKRQKWDTAVGNIALTQVQSIVVGLLASFVAILLGWGPLIFSFTSSSADAAAEGVAAKAMLLCGAAVVTAALTSFVLGLLMIGVVFVSRVVGVDPDNVATPIAAALGDLTTLAILAEVARRFWEEEEESSFSAPSCLLFLFLLVAPICVAICRRNPLVAPILASGWTPVISAMGISSLGGLILNRVVAIYSSIAAFQPIINGVGGNLVGVMASRISTDLHREKKTSDDEEEEEYSSPSSSFLRPFLSAFLGSSRHSLCARVLLALVLPGHLLFLFALHLFNANERNLNFAFLFAYLMAAHVQVVLLLTIALWLVRWLWRRGIDPDDAAIPYLTSLGDLFGTALLAAAFVALDAVGVAVS